ncbi:MAG TPA: alpha/beta hydrolase, partial [Thermoanaerobaculia bacterium]|nr:alpha/beta hydrolase [Thermoanaerobaculia bacterium]
MRRRTVFATLCVLVIFLAFGFFLLPAFEHRSIYFPSAAYDAAPESFGLRADPLEIGSAGGIRLAGWWIRGSGETALVYLHGNGGNISHRLERTKMLVDSLRLDVFLVDYRGYGRSTGMPSEVGLYADG